MKQINWEGKMRLSEYAKVCKWCRDNCYREEDLGDGTFHYVNKIECGITIKVSNIISKFVDTRLKFVLSRVRIQYSASHPTGLFDTIIIEKNVSTFDEFIEFVEKVDSIQELKMKFKI